MKITTILPLIVPSLFATSPLRSPKDLTTGSNISNIYIAGTKDKSSLATQKKTAKRFIDAYNAWDADAVMEYRSPGCYQQALPSSMGKLAKNNLEYSKYFQSIMPLFSNFTVTVHKEVHDANARMSVIHASSTANTRIGTYTNEYALFITFTRDGEKVAKIEEFVDSAYSTRFFAQLAIPT